jgi:cell division protein FtsW
MPRTKKTDKTLFLAAALLVSASLVMVYSASAPVAAARFQDPYHFLNKQVMWVALGVAILALTMRFPYTNYRQPVFIATSLGVALVALVAVLFCPPINGSTRWFSLGGVSVQPSEFAKLVVIVLCAWFLERHLADIDEVRKSLPPLLAALAVIVVLVAVEEDFGTAVVLCVIGASMVFAAGLSYRYVAGGGASVAMLMAFFMVMAPYRRARLLVFLHPESDLRGDGYQLFHSLIAVGTGGLTGRGFGESVQKLHYLPEPHNDFIYAVVSEELGLIGATAILVCFCVIAWRGFRVAARVPDAFGSLLAVGLTVMIVVQAFTNMGVVLGMLPTKGIPLPFVSAGGSSLLASMAGTGMLLNLSQHADG